MREDYPAAHSMDTEWFAVDRDGHVALFKSGEAGAVPVGACILSSPDGSDEELSGELQRLAGTRAYEYPFPESPDHEAADGEAELVLMFLDSLDPVRDEVDRGAAVPVKAEKGVAVKWVLLPADVSKRLHDTDACLACTEWHVDPPEAYGAFSYEHTTENWISGPYQRFDKPALPLRVADLPEELAEKLSALRLPEVSFSDVKKLQPVEYVECESWECAWLSLDGTRAAPVPGKEGEYSENYDELKASEPGIQWQRPGEEDDAL